MKAVFVFLSATCDRFSIMYRSILAQVHSYGFTHMEKSFLFDLFNIRSYENISVSAPILLATRSTVIPVRIDGFKKLFEFADNK